MLMEIDVADGGNSPLMVNRIFDLLDQPRDITGVFTAGQDGEDRWCRVTGWSSLGPCPAKSARSEDSGEGVILLVYGGDEGIRAGGVAFRQKPRDLLFERGDAALGLGQFRRLPVTGAGQGSDDALLFCQPRIPILERRFQRTQLVRQRGVAALLQPQRLGTLVAHHGHGGSAH